jgi:hypothetical protein
VVQAVCSPSSRGTSHEEGAITASDDDLNRDLADDDLEDPAGIRRPPQDLAEEDPGDPGISRPPGW